MVVHLFLLLPSNQRGKEDKAEMTRMREGRKREEEFKGLVM